MSGSEMWILPVPVWEKIVRSILVYLALIALLRVFGKRELAQLNPFDLVVLLMLSNTVQNSIIGNDNSLVGGLLGALTLLAVNYAVVRFVFRHRRLDQILAGRPTILIQHGKVLRRNLAGELLSESELRTVAHKQGFAALDEIEECVLEPGGTFFLRGKPGRAGDIQAIAERLSSIDSRLERLERRS